MKLRKGGHGDLERYYPLLETDCSRAELLPKLLLHAALSLGSAELLIACSEDNGADAAYAFVLPGKQYDSALLKYFAVFPWMRGKKIGTEFMKLLLERYEGKRFLLAELPEKKTETGTDSRRQFLRSFGFMETECEFSMPGRTMELMARPMCSGSEAEQASFADLLRDCYRSGISARIADRMFRTDTDSKE